MTRLRRRSRAVYRVYGEEEYLAGADALAAWEDVPPSGEPAHGRRLQRLAGAAALTGAVGTVGGVVGLAGLRTHAGVPREIAQRVPPPPRAAASRRHASAHVQTARREIPHLSPSPLMHARHGRVVRLALDPRSRAEMAARAIAVSASPITHAHRSQLEEIPDRPASSNPGSATNAPSAAAQAPAATARVVAAASSPATEARPGAQSEFGFER